MARIRSIKPEFPQSESMGNVSRDARGHFIKSAIPASVRIALAERHGCKPGLGVDVKCHYCDFIGSVHWFIGSGRKNSKGWVAFSGLEMDHVEPEILGGTATEKNIVLACQPCNRSKGSKRVEAWKGERNA